MTDETETSPVDGTVADVSDHLETVTDPAELAILREAEIAGKNRAGALAAIDAREKSLSDDTATEVPVRHTSIDVPYTDELPTPSQESGSKD